MRRGSGRREGKGAGDRPRWGTACGSGGCRRRRPPPGPARACPRRCRFPRRTAATLPPRRSRPAFAARDHEFTRWWERVPEGDGRKVGGRESDITGQERRETNEPAPALGSASKRSLQLAARLSKSSLRLAARLMGSVAHHHATNQDQERYPAWLGWWSRSTLSDKPGGYAVTKRSRSRGRVTGKLCRSRNSGTRCDSEGRWVNHDGQVVSGMDGTVWLVTAVTLTRRCTTLITSTIALFVWLISHQSVVLFSQNNQPSATS
jgi:hypothetical protein